MFARKTIAIIEDNMTTDTAALQQQLAALPKIELHVHLEGAIQPPTLLRLAKRHDIRLPGSDEDALRKWYKFRDFPHFADIFQQVSTCIRTPDDIEEMTYDFLDYQQANNVLYTEFHYTAYTHYRNRGIAFADQLAAVNRARRRAKSDFDTSSNIIVDIPRERVTPEEALTIADWVIGSVGDGVVALGLAGYEPGHPPRKFEAAFKKAADAHVPIVSHAGETSGVESIREAVEVTRPARIAHGVFALDDPELARRIRDEGIVCDVCPTSNIALRVFDSWEDHTLPRMLDEGIAVTINTDDPPMFDTDMTREYISAVDKLRLSRNDLRTMYRTAVRGALCTADEKSRLTKALETF